MLDMGMSERREMAQRLMAYCRIHRTGRYDTYQFYQRVITDVGGAEHDQTLFADGVVMLDVTHMMACLTAADGEQGVDVDHWHDSSASDFRHVDLAAAWDRWEAEATAIAETAENLDALNLYGYYGNALCQWFSVIGSDDDCDGQDAHNYSRRVLINTAYLNLLAIDREALQGHCSASIAADGRVRVVNDSEAVTLGYVMPFGAGMEAPGHRGQLKACPACGGDGLYHAMPMNEAVTK